MKLLNCIIFFLILSSCNVELENLPKPKNLIERNTFKKILKEILIEEQIALGVQENSQFVLRQSLLKGEKVIKQNKATPKQFDESFTYYASIHEEMDKIYEEIIEELTNDINLN